jgi:L,D-peptidoglycan transpeptidase YkuD (ErfK/YbiS/YcfS/YnhG family)
VRLLRGTTAILAIVVVAGCASSARTSPPAAAQRASVSAVAATTSAPAHRHASPPLLVDHLVGVGGASQVVSVTASGYGTSYARLRAFERTSHGWREVFGPWAARVGYNGFAPPGHKREGDGRTPTGSYGVQFMFGVNADPGVRFSYRRALTTSWWDDDPASPSYNEWVDGRGTAGRSPESMHRAPSYLYGAVIGYNTARTPGLGSAIFLHVSHVGATSGCVSIPEGELLAVLRWLDPAQQPRVVMGPTSAVTR